MAADVTPLRKAQPAKPALTPEPLFPEARFPEPLFPEPLWREVLGSRLRELRHERGERLTETAARAGISPQYLSEVERGRKEPSSEMIAALAGAFGLALIDLTRLVTEDLRPAQDLRPAHDLRSTQGLRREAAGQRQGLRGSGPVALLARAA
jgi:transcriptional regulator with XRE-family HTH domain